MNTSKTTSVRFSLPFLEFIKSFSAKKSSTTLIRNLVESISSNELALRTDLSNALQESTQAKLNRLEILSRKELGSIDLNDVAFVLICCHRAYLRAKGVTLIKSTYIKSIVSIVRELIPMFKVNGNIDVNQIYIDLGFEQGKGIDEQFDALQMLPYYSTELGEMQFLCHVTDHIHLISSTNNVSKELTDRLKSVIPVAVLGIISDANISDRLSAVGSKLFAPNARVTLDMHEYINNPDNSLYVLPDGRELKFTIGHTGMIQAVLRSSDSRFEMTFTTISTIELIDFAIANDNAKSGLNTMRGRDLSLSAQADTLTMKVCNVSILIPLEIALHMFAFIKNLSNHVNFYEYITYSKRTLGDL
ncbi:hypothetical protein [Vibrio sp. 10N.239.312.D08]|uniref:hypothetical protein n=1 Tax=Vibrio sp. 10N.239.312.D08 TaxID=3229978 RepID=UPI00354DC502